MFGSSKARMTLTIITVALSLLAIFWGASNSTSPSAPARTGEFAIRNVRLFDGTGLIEAANVVVRKGKIVEAGATVSIPSGMEVVDGTGKTLMPGLIDSHTHAFGDALERALSFGVTTELDMFTSVGLMQSAKKEQAEGYAYDRADLFSAGTLITVPGGHGTEYGPVPTVSKPADVDAFVEARIAEGSDYIKVILDDGSAWGLSFPTVDAATLRAAVVAAHKRHKLVVVHVATIAAAREAVDAGADGLAHVWVDAVPDGELIRQMKKHKTFVVATLSVTAGDRSGSRLAEDPAILPYLTAKERTSLNTSFPFKGPFATNNHALEAVRMLHDAGIPILAGTDAPNPGTTHGASLHGELQLLQRTGFTPLQALAAATSLPAKIFGLNDRGRIAPGLRADLVLIAGNPAANIEDTRKIARIWKGGVAFDRIKPNVASTVAPGIPVDGRISMFDQGNLKSEFGNGWIVSTDSQMGGKSTATLALVSDGADKSSGAMRIKGDLKSGFAYPWAGAIFFGNKEPMQPVNVSEHRAVRFFARGDVKQGRLMLFATALGPIPAQVSFPLSPEWQQVTIPFDKIPGFTGLDFQAILIDGGPGPGPFTIDIDQVEFH